MKSMKVLYFLSTRENKRSFPVECTYIYSYQFSYSFYQEAFYFSYVLDLSLSTYWQSIKRNLDMNKYSNCMLFLERNRLNNLWDRYHIHICFRLLASREKNKKNISVKVSQFVCVNCELVNCNKIKSVNTYVSNCLCK